MNEAIFKVNFVKKYIIDLAIWASLIWLITCAIESVIAGQLQLAPISWLIMGFVGALIVTFLDRNNLRKIRLNDDEITVSSVKGDAYSIKWSELQSATDNRNKKFKSRLWVLTDKNKNEIYIPKESLTKRQRDELSKVLENKISTYL